MGINEIKHMDLEKTNKYCILPKHIDKADTYLDAHFNTLGGNGKLRSIGNPISLNATKIFCDAYEQGLKDSEELIQKNIEKLYTKCWNCKYFKLENIEKDKGRCRMSDCIVDYPQSQYCEKYEINGKFTHL